MTYTEQQKALKMVKEIWPNGFTEDHIHYRRVGYKDGPKTFSCIGETWNEAIEGLKAKVQGVVG
jgi:hypothetical protein